MFNLPSYSSKLQYNSNKKYETMTNKFLLDNFTKYFKDENKAKELLEFLKNNRKYENKISLKKKLIIYFLIHNFLYFLEEHHQFVI